MVAVPDGAGRERGQVGPGVGFGEALAPHLAVESGGQMGLALGVLPAASRVTGVWWRETMNMSRRGESARASSWYSTTCSARDIPPPG
jgi:hypothetical protein